MKTLLLIILFCIFSFSVIDAQSSSVYSRYGIGDLEYSYSPKMISIGDIGVTQLDPDHLIVSNPASWSALSRTRIEFGFGYKGVQISDQSQSYFTSETDFKGFTFGFPVSRDYGIGFVAGLVPYSRVSYKAEEKVESSNTQIPTYKVLYEGKGGLSKLFVGSSVMLPFGFLGGVSLDYYFGNQNYFSSIEFDNSKDFINVVRQNNRRSTGFGTTAGIISSNLSNDFKLGLFDDLRLGFSFNYIGNLNTDTLLTSTSLFLVDTVAFASTETKIPVRFNGGISFVFDESYNISLDYMYQPMSEYSFNYLKDSHLRNMAKYSAALEYKPKKSAGMTNWEQIIWRFGLSYEQTQYRFNGQGINQFSTFAGLSYPLGVDNTIDFAIQYSNRGTTENNLLNENAIRVYFGLSFGELWFLRFDN
ncbi:MAG: hypothetical protein Q8M94_19950 [Ignavibacteria bacterium]|nr:hypothetical protein [Ignavibacteria bacterium]